MYFMPLKIALYKEIDAHEYYFHAPVFDELQNGRIFVDSSIVHYYH